MSDIDLIKKARELTRTDRRYSFKEHIARLTLVNLFGTELDEGVTVVTLNEMPAKIYAGDMQGDICVFMKMTGTNSCEPVGWLTLDEVEESEIEWVYENEEKVDYYHEIPEKCMIEMPLTPDFTEPCKHLGYFMWSHDTACWECLECNRNLIHQDAREQIQRQDSQLTECG